MANFEDLNGKEDSSKFGMDTEDVGVRSPMEGGYVLTRPRSTRKPRRTYMTGFTDISQKEFDVFYSFWESVGTFKAFNYVVRTKNELINVRFAEKPSFKYTGMGNNFRWDVDNIKLEEV